MRDSRMRLAFRVNGKFGFITQKVCWRGLKYRMATPTALLWWLMMLYAIPMMCVAIVIPAFFTIARRRYAAFGKTQWALLIVIALFLLVAAVGHFVRPALFASIIPPFFPYHHSLVIVSGIFEAAGAIGLLIPQTRHVASVYLALMMVAVFPANIYIAGATMGGMVMPDVEARTLMQMVFVLLILLAGWGIPGRKEAEKL